jgi:predicted enzyme related to lactoylglutathione lyase
MRANQLFAGVPTADLAAARAFYERLLGRPPDMTPHAREVAWQVSEHGWIYVVEDAPRAGHATLTLLVDDLDAAVAGMVARGIEVPAPQPVGPSGRSVHVAGPEDATIQVAQVG